MLGLWWLQRERMGRLGLLSAAAYAYAYVFFSFTVVYALVEGTPDFSTLGDELGAWMTLHGAIMVLSGIGFGYAVVRAGLLPRWTGIALGVGVVLVAITDSMPEGPQLVAAAVRDLAFAGMGWSLLAPRLGRPGPVAHRAAGG